MIELIVLGATLAGIAGSYLGTRNFVRERLRYVDAVHRRSAPVLAGLAAAAVAAPVVWVLPVVGGGSALLFGVAVGAGVNAGRKAHKELPPGRGYERL